MADRRADSHLIERLAGICTPEDSDKVRRFGQALVKLADAADSGILHAKGLVMSYQQEAAHLVEATEQVESLLLPPRSFEQFQAERKLEKLAGELSAAGDRRDGDEADRLEAEMDKLRKVIETEKEKALEGMKG